MKITSKVLRTLKALLLVGIFLGAVGCNKKENSTSQDPQTGPRTSFGQAVKSAKDLDAAAEERNKELAAEAAALEQEK